MRQDIVLDSAWGTPDEGKPSQADLRRERLRSLVRRSIMYVPVNVPKYVTQAYLRGADAIMLDLEDSVPPAEKATARTLVRPALSEVAKGGADVLVRINKPYSLAVADLEAVVWPGLAGVHFPKTESPREIETIDRLISELEVERGMPLGAIQISVAMETALGIYNALPIALASPRIVAVAAGSEDFTLDIEVEPTKEGRELFYSRVQMIMVARLSGAQPLGTMASTADYRDLDAMAETIRYARQMGFVGASCIHPAQVAPLNTYFSPPVEQVTQARKVIAALEAAVAEGRGSVGVDGKMVDVPVVERARRLIDRAEAIEAKEAKKRAALAALG